MITVILLVVVLAAVVLFFGRKKFKKWEKIVCICMAVLLLVLGGGSTIKSLVLHDIKTVVGIYESKIREATGLSPFQMEYCFVCENKKHIWI